MLLSGLTWVRLKITTKKVFKEDKESNYCDHVHNLMTIRSNGDVVACCYDLTSKFNGNILQEDPIKIWNNQEYHQLRESIKSKFLNQILQIAVVKPNKYHKKIIDFKLFHKIKTKSRSSISDKNFFPKISGKYFDEDRIQSR